jgi:hypothetical protein
MDAEDSLNLAQKKRYGRTPVGGGRPVIFYPSGCSSYEARKEHRRKEYEKNHGRKMIVCTACSGSGYYDTSRNGRTPKCGSCEGTGKHLEPLPREPIQTPHWRDALKQKNALVDAKRRHR